MGDLEQHITQTALAQGFVLAGWARVRRLDERAEFYREGLKQGRFGEMTYLENNFDRRLDPRLFDPRVRSVVTLAYPYAPPPVAPPQSQGDLRGRIASYAVGPDYHETVLGKVRMVAAAISELAPGALTRSYVDTGPVLEREWAMQARLGWFGKNTNLLNQRQGSYFFVGEIFTDLELDGGGEPYRDHCGRCRRCLDDCPTGALSEGYRLDSRLCISYLTIELRGPIPPDLRPKIGNWVFGCDICQQVCPWNSDADTREAETEAYFPYLPELMRLDDENFRRRFGKTAVKRAKRRGLLRNAAVALGNSGNPEAAAVLADVLRTEPEPLVRAHAAWALGRLGAKLSASALLHSLKREADSAVRAEVSTALERL